MRGPLGTTCWCPAVVQQEQNQVAAVAMPHAEASRNIVESPANKHSFLGFAHAQEAHR